MKHFGLLAGTLLLIGTAAFAGPPAKKDIKAAPTAATPATISCAVETGNKVNIKAATAAKRYADYKSNRYFFCCTDCPEQFKKDPAKFAKNAHIKTPVLAKK